MKDWGLLKYYFRMLVTRLRREMKNSVNVGLTDIRTEILITLEVLEDQYLEVDVKWML